MVEIYAVHFYVICQSTVLPQATSTRTLQNAICCTTNKTFHCLKVDLGMVEEIVGRYIRISYNPEMLFNI